MRNRFTVDPARPPTAVRIELKQEPAAGLLFDVRSGRVLWQLHPRRELPIASLTKMMTALLIAERHRAGEMVRITREAINYEGSAVGVLPQGERVRLGALLYGLMLVSGNDAAIALAQHDARTQRRFVARMNRRARRLGLALLALLEPQRDHRPRATTPARSTWRRWPASISPTRRSAGSSRPAAPGCPSRSRAACSTSSTSTPSSHAATRE